MMTWLLGWVSHGECNSVHGYKLDKTYDKSWHKTISCHDSPSY